MNDHVGIHSFSAKEIQFRFKFKDKFSNYEVQSLTNLSPLLIAHNTYNNNNEASYRT